MSSSGNNSTQQALRGDGGAPETELQKEMRIAAQQQQRDAATAKRSRLERFAAAWLKRGRQEEIEEWLGTTEREVCLLRSPFVVLSDSP